jgi:hypothetical protein
MSFVVRAVLIVIFAIYVTANVHARVGLCPHTPAQWPTFEPGLRPLPELFNLGLTHQVAALKGEFRRFRHTAKTTC